MAIRREPPAAARCVIDRRRRRRDEHRLPPGEARLARRRPARPQPADQRLDLPLRRAGRAAARLGVADEDDDVQRRAVPAAARGVRVRPGVDGVRKPAARLERGAHGGAAPPGRLGQDVRPPDGAGLGRRGGGDVPPHRRPRACWAPPGCPPTATSIPRSSPTRSPTARGRAAARCSRTRGWSESTSTTAACAGVRTERGRHRGRGRRQRRRHVRRGDRADGRRARADRADGARVPRDPAVPRARRRPPAHAARPRPAHLLPRGGRRPGHGRIRAPLRALVADRRRRRLRRDPARLQRPAAGGGVGPASRRSSRTPSAGCRRWRT